MTKLRLTLILLATSAFSAFAAIPLDYYTALDGKTGEELKNAIWQTVGDQVLDTSADCQVYTFGSGKPLRTWWALYYLDRIGDKEVRDRYSNEKFYFTERGNSVSGTAIEHSMPKSWWQGETDVLKTTGARDLHQLLPSESKINSSKSNNPIGKVAVVTNENGVTKIGTNADGYKVWEPGDQWKGDFARIYMYMATTYQDYTWTKGDWDKNLEQNTYPTLNEKTQQLLIKWARQDAVDMIETTRNNNVYGLQGNRNPYVDFPNLMEYVWGDSVGQPFNVLTTVKAEPSFGKLLTADDTEKTVYENTLVGVNTQFTIENAVCPDDFTPWKQDGKSGWRAEGLYDDIENLEIDSKLVSPEIDLEGYDNVYMWFQHALRNVEDPNAVCEVLVREPSGRETPLPMFHWPATSNNNYYNTGRIYLSQFAGKKIRIVFHYTSTPEEACWWAIKNMKITATGVGSGIENVTVDQPSDNTTISYYSVDGRVVNPASFKGLVIKKQGSKSAKMILK